MRGGTKILLLLLALLVVLLLIFGPKTTVYTTQAFICVNTGSKKNLTENVFFSKEEINRSLLEEHYVTNKITFSHKWVQYSHESYNILGGGLYINFCDPPEMLWFDVPFQEYYLANFHKNNYPKPEDFLILSDAEKDEVILKIKQDFNK